MAKNMEGSGSILGFRMQVFLSFLNLLRCIRKVAGSRPDKLNDFYQVT
jgi:hypothetical protein